MYRSTEMYRRRSIRKSIFSSPLHGKGFITPPRKKPFSAGGPFYGEGSADGLKPTLIQS